MRLGIFGGTFDPPHIGHLILAAEAFAQFELDRVLWVLTPNPPHKTRRPLTPVELRYDLLQAAVEDDPAFVISRMASRAGSRVIIFAHIWLSFMTYTVTICN